MTRIAISGHRGLSTEVTGLVDKAIRQHLAEHASGGTIIGLSCLADGADQLFARAVLDLGGHLEVVVPAEQYRDRLPVEAHADYDELIARATAVHRMDAVESTSSAHQAASVEMLKRVDRLFAVWDGQPSRSYGGTADVVAAAHELGLPVTVIWPAGATRK